MKMSLGPLKKENKMAENMILEETIDIWKIDRRLGLRIWN